MNENLTQTLDIVIFDLDHGNLSLVIFSSVTILVALFQHLSDFIFIIELY